MDKEYYYFKLITGDNIIGEYVYKPESYIGVHKIFNPIRFVVFKNGNDSIMSLGRIVPYMTVEEIEVIDEHVIAFHKLNDPLLTWFKSTIENFKDLAKKNDKELLESFDNDSDDDEEGFNSLPYDLGTPITESGNTSNE